MNPRRSAYIRERGDASGNFKAPLYDVCLRLHATDDDLCEDKRRGKWREEDGRIRGVETRENIIAVGTTIS